MIDLVAFHIKKKRKKSQGVEGVRFPLAYKPLHTSIKKYLGLDIPCQAVCSGHNAPFDVFYDSFTEKTLNCIVIANRGGGKTLNSAALEFVEASEKGLEECHLGAIMAQAKRAYKYIYSWAYKYREKMGINKITIGETLFKNGGSIEIIPGTMNGVNSPHPHKATIDEFELLPWEIFEEAGSMPRSGTNGRAALRLYTTRKKASGNAQLMISEAETRGFKLYKWCIFEVMTPCLSSLPCKKCPYKKHVTFNNEGDKVTWPSVCQGKAKKSRGYIPFEDVLKVFKSLSWEIFDAQWLCNRPERYDGVFCEFNFDRNTIDSWKFQEGWQWGRGWDFGLDDPTAVLFFQFNENTGEIIQFNELVISGYLIDEVAEKVRGLSDKLAPPEAWIDWGDPSGRAVTGIEGQSYISKLAEHEIEVQSQSLRVNDGIQAIKKSLRLSSFTGQPLYKAVRGSCPKTIQALEMSQWDRLNTATSKYSREKYRHDEHSHPLDALRYFITGVFPLVENTISFGL